MKYYTLIFLSLSSLVVAQPNTDVFLFDLNRYYNNFEISNFRNISNNEGYDNQPSFLDDNTILYAATRKGQTDISKYNINYDSKIWINFTEGSEYSPLKIPDQNAVSAIRLENDGAQKLYKYNLSNGESEVLVEDIIIGYHVWYTNDVLVSSVLEEGGLSLYATHFEEKMNNRFHKNIGRSLHKIPDSDLVSFVSKADENLWEIKSLHPRTGVIKSIVGTLNGAEDMCWLPDGTILMGKDDILYTFKKDKDVDWNEVASLEEYGITNITRLAVSPDGTKLAIVGEGGKTTVKDPDAKLEPKLENIAWISGNWKGEALGGIVEENWSAANGDSMMATFRLIKDDKVVFYEIEIIREVNNSLVLQLKHFNNDLKGWEAQDETVDFPLKEITANKVIFEGMTFERIGDKEMNVFVDMRKDDGTVDVLKFNYKKE